MRFTTATIAAAASLFSVVRAHMILHSPNPYGAATINNSPLAADGSDFPCKLRTGVYDDPVAANDMTIGETNYLSFEGSVVHSGGSCQVSLTTDAQPDASSDWVVIHSIIGGCPSNHSGNFEVADASSLTDATVFSYKIPDSIDPGTYTLAWTWFNNEGNREMYMNCAPITVAAASKKRSTHKRHLHVEERDTQTSPNPNKRSLPSDLPKMFVANIGNGCSTADSTDVVFPDPGSSVEEAGSGTTQAAPIGSCGSSSSGSSGSASSAVASSVVAATPVASSAGSPVESATSAPAPAETTAAAETTPVAATSTVASAPAGTSAPASTSSGTASSGGGSQLTGACTDEGEFNCIGGTSYQQCASGSWSVVMSVAAGTECTTGLSTDLGIKFASDKMMKRHMNSRIMRSHSHARRGSVGYH